LEIQKRNEDNVYEGEVSRFPNVGVEYGDEGDPSSPSVTFSDVTEITYMQRI
jgi:hypothetical protein